MFSQARTRGLIALALALTLFGSTSNSLATPNDRFDIEDVFEIVNVGVQDVSNDGRWIAVTATSLGDRIGADNHRFGDPTYIAPSLSEVSIIETATGISTMLFPEKKQVRSLRWSPDATMLALLVLTREAFQPFVWDRGSGQMRSIDLPAGKHVADNSDLRWSPDGKHILLALRSDEWRKQARERFEAETKGPIVVLSSKDPFLSWEELRRMSLRRSLAVHDLQTGTTRELIPETDFPSYTLSEDGTFVGYLQDITKKTDYDVIFGADNQVDIVPFEGGPARTVIKSTKGLTLTWSRDGRCYAYSKEGDLFFGSVDDEGPRQLTGKKEDPKPDAQSAPAEKPGDEKAGDDKKRFTAVRLNRDGSRLVASSKEGLWLIQTQSGDKDLFIKTPEEQKDTPRHQLVDWSPDSRYLYLSYSSRTSWERGVVRYDLESKKLEDLVKDGRLYQGIRLSHDGSTFVFNSATGNRPYDVHVADSSFRAIRRLTDANPHLEKKLLSRTELISYLDVDGNRLNGVLYYPVDYEEGKKYPTVFNLYEQFFDDNFNATINVLTSNGYAVMQPSVNLEIGFPGEAWMKGVTGAANKLIEMGVADPDRLGVQGTSYGGYATNLLISQTNRFKAAINISGKVNMVSFYTDSPRLGVRNIHAPEKSQDRIGATLWQQPQKYIQHSAIMSADRIKTPLLLMTGDQDHNVPARQALEMYYALRRLGREVEWVNYVNGGHGMPTTTVEEVRDYYRRILDWYERHLKRSDKPAEEVREQVPQR